MYGISHRHPVWLLLILLTGLAGCDPDEASATDTPQPAVTAHGDRPTPTDTLASGITQGSDAPEPAEYVETGDLAALILRGKLRILVPANLERGHYLPRKGSPVGHQQETAEAFSRALGLEPVPIPVASFGQMIPLLLEGKGDLIAANLAVTEGRSQKIAFSVPLVHVREQLVTRLDDDLERPEDLAGRTIAVERATSFWQTVAGLQQKYPYITLEPLPPAPTDAVLDMVARQEIDLTVEDSNVMEMFLGYRDDLKVAFDVSDRRVIAWGVRPNASLLLRALNRYLHQEHLTRRAEEAYKEDLPGLKRRKALRLLIRNNAASYFLWRGELLGFEYELAKRYAQKNGMRLEIVVPPSHEAMLPWLQEGRADIAAGFLTPTEARKAMGVEFSRPYHFAPELVIRRAGEQGLDGPEDLAGRSVVVRRSSAYWSTLEGLQRQGIALELVAAPEDMETEDIIARVADGEFDLTVADGHILNIELTWRDDVDAAFPLGESMPHAWAVRPDSPKLLQDINRFLKKEYRGLFYNMTYKKYFRNPRKIRAHLEERVDRVGGGSLSPYDDLARSYADRYDFDWRLVVSQMYQESRFDPRAKSWAGALGLMQVMPRTARQIELSDLKDPETGVHAGVKYLDWLRERFEPELPVADRMWFTLASYNAGAGHVHDARRLARQMGWDPDRWFGSVERAMLLLSKRKYARKARHGYVRGAEPVKYVREIRDRYRAYVRLTDGSVAQRRYPPTAAVPAG